MNAAITTDTRYTNLPVTLLTGHKVELTGRCRGKELEYRFLTGRRGRLGHTEWILDREKIGTAFGTWQPGHEEA
jgi:hypothetical protein